MIKTKFAILLSVLLLAFSMIFIGCSDVDLPERDERVIAVINLSPPDAARSTAGSSILDSLIAQATSYSLIVSRDGTNVFSETFPANSVMEIELYLGEHAFVLEAFKETEIIGRGVATAELAAGRNAVSIPLVLDARWSVIPLARIPAGTFIMGSPETEIGRWDDGYEDQREVTLEGFYMGITPITGAQWEAVIDVAKLRGWLPPGWLSPGGAPPVWSTTHGTPVGYSDGPNHPALISWYDALVFSNLLSMKEGLSPAYRIGGSTDPADWGLAPHMSMTREFRIARREIWGAVEIVPGSAGYRLPVAEQWEYACRAGTTTAFNDGITDDWEDREAVGRLGWFYFNSGSHFMHPLSGIHEVGLKQPNVWGLYDMHGNVWEWCWDLYMYESPLIHRTAVRVIRGGSGGTSARWARSASRGLLGPTATTSTPISLRVVRPLND